MEDIWARSSRITLVPLLQRENYLKSSTEQEAVWKSPEDQVHLDEKIIRRWE